MGVSNFRASSIEARTREFSVISGHSEAAVSELRKQRNIYRLRAMGYFMRSLSRLIEKGAVPPGSSIDRAGKIRIPGRKNRVDISRLL